MTSSPSSHIVGIFGPPGSGKSTVLSFFAERGFATWNADETVARLYVSGGAGARRIGEYFGEKFLAKDGGVLKNKLAKMVLSKPLKLRILEHLIHPLVLNEAVHWMDEQKKLGQTCLALEAAVFELDGLGRHVDFLVKVDAKKEVCRQRVLARGKTEMYFDALYSVTNTYETAYVIENSGTLDSLKKQFEKLPSAITMCG